MEIKRKVYTKRYKLYIISKKGVYNNYLECYNINNC